MQRHRTGAHDVTGKLAAVVLACSAMVTGGCAFVQGHERSTVIGAEPSVAEPSVAEPSVAERGLRGLDYVFALDERLRTLTATVCLRGQSKARLVPGIASARSALIRAEVRTNLGYRPIEITDRGVPLERAGADGCVRYVIDVDRAIQVGPLSARFAGQLALSTSTWLWGPAPWPQGIAVQARFALPVGAEVGVPWRSGNRRGYTLDRSAFRFVAYAAFGRLDTQVLSIPCGRLRVHVLGDPGEGMRSRIEPWLATQAAAAARLTGCAPASEMQIIVLPAGSTADPVPFGSVGRGGGFSMTLLLAQDAELEALRRDWVVVHEMTHMHAPFVRREDAWFSEGLATYYQNVLLTRAQLLPDQGLWRNLDRGLRRGEVSAKKPLAEASRRMFETRGFQHVYWGGAGFMLKADVRLRLHTEGAWSLDRVVRALSACCGASSRVWSVQEVLARMDAISGTDVLSTLYRQEVNTQAFPDLRETYRSLGLAREGDGLRLDTGSSDDARRAIALRRAIARGAVRDDEAWPDATLHDEVRINPQ